MDFFCHVQRCAMCSTWAQQNNVTTSGIPKLYGTATMGRLLRMHILSRVTPPVTQYTDILQNSTETIEQLVTMDTENATIQSMAGK
jgi:hypothetical protein